MAYTVKELFYTLQGEGARAGRAAVFVRFAGCNLWTGREADRARGAGGCARWCDTDFVGTDGDGGGRFATAEALAGAAARACPIGHETLSMRTGAIRHVASARRMGARLGALMGAAPRG